MVERIVYLSVICVVRSRDLLYHAYSTIKVTKVHCIINHTPLAPFTTAHPFTGRGSNLHWWQMSIGRPPGDTDPTE